MFEKNNFIQKGNTRNTLKLKYNIKFIVTKDVGSVVGSDVGHSVG